MSIPSAPSGAEAGPAAERRSFVTAALAVVIGAMVTIIPVIPGVAFVLDPLLRKKRGAAKSGDDFVKITTLEALPRDGSPQAFPVIQDLQDAWNKFPQTEVGAVFLSRLPDGGLACFNARCTHLGCTINYVPAAQNYRCPCHASCFSLDGQRTNDIPPRPMDTLQAEIRNGDEIWVEFQNFRAGTSERKPIS